MICTHIIIAIVAASHLAAHDAPDVRFNKQTISKEFVAEGCTVADFNRDGKLDIAAGRFIWLGPDFTQQSAYTPERDNPAGINKTPYRADTGYSDYFIEFAYDFNADGWPDILVYGLPGTPASVFVNPGVALDHVISPAWSRADIFDIANGESPDFIDITADGKPELLCHTNGQFGYAEIDWSKPPNSPLAKARFRPITPKTPEGDKAIFQYTHGYGAGDINRDGRTDIIASTGWYEQPADVSQDSNWKLHGANFGEGGAQMYAFDVNGDGRNDVITSIKAHGYGLSWFEQNADGTFAERAILGRAAADNANDAGFSQIHALRVIDINGDGLLDIVAGKRRWAHGPMGDDEPMAAPVLCWFELKRDGNGNATFTKHLIDADSGVGTQLWTGDINADAKPDAVVANKHGVFVFTQK